MSIWVVNTRGVCAAEIFGAYSTEDKAVKRAETLYAQSDGYHSFEVTELVVDEDHYPERWERHLMFDQKPLIRLRNPKPTIDITYRKEDSNGST